MNSSKQTKEVNMKLNEIKYRRCNCGISFTLAHWKPNKYLNDGQPRLPDNFVRHNNIACSPCLRKSLERLDSIAKRRNLTDDEMHKAGMIQAMLP